MLELGNSNSQGAADSDPLIDKARIGIHATQKCSTTLFCKRKALRNPLREKLILCALQEIKTLWIFVSKVKI